MAAVEATKIAEKEDRAGGGARLHRPPGVVGDCGWFRPVEEGRRGGLESGDGNVV